MTIHKSITLDRVTEAVEETMFGLENAGFCLACGADAYDVEPDAEKYTCEECGAHAVYGAEQVLMMIA
jgi:hypothetical protein